MVWSSLEKDIARERVQLAAESTWLGACLHLPEGCYRPLKVRQVYVLFVIIFIVGVAGVINCFLTRYWTYRDVIRFVDVTCETLSAEVTYRNLTCACGEQCRGRYGCLVVYTRFKTLEGRNVSAVLFATDMDLAISRRALLKCTYHPPCGATRHEAARHLADFRRVISAPGTRYGCLYDPEDVRDVIQYRGVDPEQTASLLLGAGVVAALGLVGCILAAAVCGCSYVFSCAAAPAHIRREAEVRVVELEAMRRKTPKVVSTEKV